jgi:PPM family protein phosphatase
VIPEDDATERMPLPRRVLAAGYTDRGRVRPIDEDAFLVDENAGLYAVADGVGGNRAGEVASRIAVEIAGSALRGAIASGAAHDPERLRSEIVSAFQQADSKIHETARAREEFQGMATTLVLAVLADSSAWIAHIGDSRAYLHRSGELRRLTEDHSVIARLERDNPALDVAIWKQSPLAHMLLRCLGKNSDSTPEIREYTLEPGDRLLLCCDGLTDMVPDPSIARLLDGGSPEDCCRELIAAANAAGGKDNITAVVIDIET